MTDEFSFKITEKIGEISKGKGGWSLELNLVSWGEREPKYDLRSWSQDHLKMSKGITLTKEDLASLRNLLNNINLD